MAVLTDIGASTRKHPRDFDDDEFERDFEKRLRLDPRPRASAPSGPIIYGVSKPLTVPTPDINSFVASRLYLHFNQVYAAQATLIPWYNPHFVVVYHFQRWVLRLFNRFYKKFCARSGVKAKAYRSFAQVMALLHNTAGFTWADMERVLREEAYLERRKLHLRLLSRRHAEDDEKLHDVAYDYWDKVRLDDDVAMLEPPLDDADMEID